MGLTEETRKVSMRSGGVAPKFGPMPTWCALSGLGRSKSYEMLGDGTLRAIKVGKRLLIDIEHGLSVLDEMPKADIRVGRPRKNAA